MDLRQFTLAVLAGGESSRMGKPKAELELRGKSILEYMLGSFRWPGPTLLITAPGREHPSGAEHFDREAVDPVGGQGPLRGFLSALENSTTPVTLIVAVDMPLIGHEQLRLISEQLEANPDAPGAVFSRKMAQKLLSPVVEPFPCGVRASARKTIEDLLSSDRSSLKRLIEIAPFALIDAPDIWPDEIWTNLNSPVDFEVFRTIALHAR